MLANRTLALVSVALGAMLAQAGCAKIGAAIRNQRTKPELKKGFSFRVQDVRFPSGLRVVFLEDRSRPLVSIAVVVGSGAAADPPGKEGIAHFVEHLTYLARPDGKARRRDLLWRTGGEFNAMTSHDLTIYYGTVSSDPALVAEVLRLENDRIVKPLAGVTPSVFTSEVDVVRNEQLERAETPALGPVMSRLRALLYTASHPYARPPIGSLASIDGLTYHDALAYAERHYRPDNVTIVIGGDVDLAQLPKLIEDGMMIEATGQLPPGARMPELPPPRVNMAAPAPATAPPSGQPMVTLPRPVAAPELVVAWPLPASVGKQYWMNRFLAAETDASMSGTEDSDLAWVDCAIDHGYLGSMLVCSARLREGTHPEKSLDHLLNGAFRVWGRAGYHDSTYVLGLAQTFAAAQLTMNAEHLESRTVSLAEHVHATRDTDYFGHHNQALRGIEGPDLIKMAETYLSRDRARAVYVRPYTAAELGRVMLERDRAPAGAKNDEKIEAVEGFQFDPDLARRLMRPPGLERWKNLRLPSGLRVVMGKTGEVPIVTVGLGIPAGNAHGKAWGLAELALGLTTASFRKLERMYLWGGHMGSAQGLESIGWRLWGPSGNLKDLLEVLGDQLTNRATDRYQVKSFLRFRLPSFKQAYQTVEAIARQRLAALLFDANRRLGQRRPDDQVLEGLSASELEAWLDEHVRPDEATLVITGDIDFAEAEALVQKYLGDWKPRGRALEGFPPSPVRSEPRVEIVSRPDAPQVEVSVGCRLPAMAEQQDAIFELLERYAARRMNEVGRGLGAAYGLSAWTEIHRNGDAALVLGGGVENRRLTAVLRGIDEFLARSVSGQLDEPALGFAFAEGAHAFVRAFATTGSTVDAVLGAALRFRDPVMQLMQLPARYTGVDRSELGKLLAGCRTRQTVLVGNVAVIKDALKASAFGARR